MIKNLSYATVLAAVVGASIACAEPAKRDLIEHAGVVETIDNGPHGDSVGDYLSFSGEIFAADNKTRLGTDSGFCMRVIKGSRYECTWTVALADGQIMIAGPFLDAGDSTLAITGGTGAYKAARGEMLLHARDTTGAQYDFKLTIE